ncbi:MAG TPA: SCO family protein [Pseudolabrys sp.]|nr:SCO family protein [Pseudolabrys sp.]
MNDRTSRILLVVSAFLGGLVVFLGIVMFVAGRGPSVANVSSIGGPFTLIDQNGKPITDADMKGKPFLVFFGYTHCPDVCPTTLFEVSEVMRALGPDANRTAALFITVDPERDTPAVMKDYLSSFDPHLRGVTGTPAAIGAAERGYRVFAKKVPEKNGEYSMDHSAVVYLMDKQGHFVAPFNLKRKPEAAADDLRKYM